MRILVVNSNTSTVVTEKVAKEARIVAPPGTDVLAVNGDFGARVITTRSENAVAEHATVAAIARHLNDCAGVLIAVSFDTGLRAARELFSVPVVGMTEAALLTGCMLGGRIGIVVVVTRTLPIYQEVVAAHGLNDRIAGWRAIDNPAPYTAGDQTEADRLLVAAANQLVEQDYAEVVLLAGAVMAGTPRRLQAQVPVPVIDGINCGMRQLALLIGLNAPKPRAGSYAPPGPRELLNVSESLAAMFGKVP